MEKTKKGIILFVSRWTVATQAADKISTLCDDRSENKLSLVPAKKTKEFTPISTKVAGAGRLGKSKAVKNNPQIFPARHFIRYILLGGYSERLYLYRA